MEQDEQSANSTRQVAAIGRVKMTTNVKLTCDQYLAACKKGDRQPGGNVQRLVRLHRAGVCGGDHHNTRSDALYTAFWATIREH